MLIWAVQDGIIKKFSLKYDEIIALAYKENPLPETTEKKRGRKKKGKILISDKSA